MSNYRDQLESYLGTLNIKADRVLDVGGASNPVWERVNSWDVKEYKIADNGLEEGQYDYKIDLNDAKPITVKGFDIVFCLEVFEYVWNTIFAVAGLYDLTKQNGTLYVTFPFIYPIHNPVSNDYLRYTYMGITELLTSVGFEIEEVVPRYMKSESYGLWQQFLRLEGMHPAKGIAHNELGYIIKAKKL